MNKPVVLTASIFVQILFIATLGQIGSDLYLPSFPNIAQDFSVSASAVQFTFASYLFGYSVSHLFYGPISDRIGRRSPILFGIGLSFIGCLICLFSPSIIMLIIGRFVQGAGIGACNSVGRSFSRDFLSGSALAKVGSQIAMIGAFVLASAPTLGGYIQHYFYWRASFILLALLTGTGWLILLKMLPETHHPHKRNPKATHLRVVLRNYWTLLTHKTFIGYTLCSSLAYAGLLAYLTAAPFLFQMLVGLTPVQFGWLSFCTAFSIAISGFINGRYVVRYGIPIMIKIGVNSMLAGSVLLLLLSLTTTANVLTIMVPMMLFAFGAGLSFQNAFAGAFHPFPHMAGAAGAMYGFFQILLGSLASALIASLHITQDLPLACVLIGISILAGFARLLTVNTTL